MIRMEAVVKTYGGRTVLDVSELLLEKGKIYALLGINGSGKTTLLRIISGFETADRGKIYYNGSLSVPKEKIAYMPQKPYIFDMTVHKNTILGIKQGDKNKQSTKSVIDNVGMGRFMKSNAKSLSGGESQKVALARTLVLGRELILLDEPASSVDISSMTLIEGYIKEINEKLRSTIVFSTHNPSQAARLADEVIFINCGKIMEKTDCAAFFSSPESMDAKEFLKNWSVK